MMRVSPIRFVRAISLLPFLLVFPAGLKAQENPAQNEQTISRAFEEIGKTPWFDPKNKSLVPIELLDKPSDSAHRTSRWLPKAKRIVKPSASSTTTPNGWFNTGLSTANLIGWSILAVAFAGLVGTIFYAFSKINPDSDLFTGRKRLSEKQDLSTLMLKKMEQLPVELRRSGVDLRLEAERLMNQGSYDEAIKCLFGHQLLLLDHCGFLRLTRGKTNGQYVRETFNSRSDAATLLQATVATFEASYFGRHTPSANAFQSLWTSNQQLETLTKSALVVTQ